MTNPDSVSDSTDNIEVASEKQPPVAVGRTKHLLMYRDHGQGHRTPGLSLHNYLGPSNTQPIHQIH